MHLESRYGIEEKIRQRIKCGDRPVRGRLFCRKIAISFIINYYAIKLLYSNNTPIYNTCTHGIIIITLLTKTIASLQIVHSFVTFLILTLMDTARGTISTLQP